MTKLKWDKADKRAKDPGAVIDVSSEPGRPARSHKERVKREAELAKERKEREERSKQHDKDLMAARRARLWGPMVAKVRKKQERGMTLTSWEEALLKEGVPR
ncbi:hypothetical protein U8326_10875 [Tsuneonella sp. CC-YZS046]|uniref:hypothetical protein n=1 Tax=Tsuneonella sp. CC-YZS046 TaxID=3042152 RepID=UPI002D793685|nr:hypothetical protein [Tsuneonella sp. CC-YZS046]WRO65553.1 hypothetical protein U8326_10875 [Tsuneonella sp. CC-YZS046]